jgi:hypothetical protein
MDFLGALAGLSLMAALISVGAILLHYVRR